MTNPTALRPFRIAVPQADVDDLHRRLDHTRWPHPVPGLGSEWARGIPPDYLAALADHWRHDFDWRTQEAKLNAFEQFTTTVDGQSLHFFHIRSPEPSALPLLITHGYPSAAIEFAPLFGPLSNPREYGGDPRDAFHVIAPSLPGFGFSTPLSASGWEMGRTTAAFAEIMTRLGYEKFVAQGGDIGAGVTGRLAATLPERVLATHVNSDRGALGMAGERFPLPEGLSAEELSIIETARADWATERGYLDLQSHRPNSVATGLSDSPVQQLAWIAEKFQSWTDPAKSARDSVDREQLLTLVSLYWFTRSGSSAAQFLWETAHADLDWIAPSGVPQGWAVFNAHPLLRRIMDPQHRLEHYREYEVGGHFAAMEQPELFLDDVRACFRALRG